MGEDEEVEGQQRSANVARENSRLLQRRIGVFWE